MKWLMLGLAVFLVLQPVPAASMGEEAEFYRDWMIETPMAAGFVSGTSLGLLVEREYGKPPMPVTWQDPASVSADTHRWLAREYYHVWLLGNVAGVVFLVAAFFGTYARLPSRNGTSKLKCS